MEIEWDGDQPTEESLARAKDYLEESIDSEIIGAKLYLGNDNNNIVTLIDDLGEQYYEDDGEWILVEDIDELIPNPLGVEDISF